MSRSGYSDNLDQWPLIRWRGQVASAIRGKRGQAFLRELLAALDAMPEKRLIEGYLKDATGQVCTLGCVVAVRGLDLTRFGYPGILDEFDDDLEHNNELLGDALGIASQLVAEIEYENDEGSYAIETPEQRWTRMRAWVARQIAPVSRETSVGVGGDGR